MNSHVAFVIAAGAAVAVGATKKCFWRAWDKGCGFNYEALKPLEGSQMAKMVNIQRNEYTCMAQATKSSCEAADTACNWKHGDSECGLSAAESLKRYELMPGEVDASPMCKFYMGYLTGFVCQEHGDEVACNAAGSPCKWEVDESYAAGSIKDYTYKDLTDSCVGRPSMPGKCVTNMLQALCPGVKTTEAQMQKIFSAEVTCSSLSVDNEQMTACMTDKGACTGMLTVEALAAYRRNKKSSADVILIGGTLKACFVEKTCAAYADVWDAQVQQMTYDASDFPLCSDFTEEKKCVGSCLWTDSGCKSKKSVIAGNFPSLGPDCTAQKLILMMGRTSETDEGKFSIWSSQKKCEQTDKESACTQSTTCKWSPPSNGTRCDGEGKKSVSEQAGQCRWMDKTETDDAANLQLFQSYGGTSWNSQMFDIVKTCNTITDKSSCESVEMSESEENIMIKASESGSASGAMGLGVSGGSGFWSACACMAALLPFAA